MKFFRDIAQKIRMPFVKNPQMILKNTVAHYPAVLVGRYALLP